MTSADKRYQSDRRKQRSIGLRFGQEEAVKQNFGLDPMYIGPIVAHGYYWRKNHCGSYCVTWRRKFKNTDALKKHLVEKGNRYVVDYAMPADCDR